MKIRKPLIILFIIISTAAAATLLAFAAGGKEDRVAPESGHSRILVVYFSRVGNTDFPADIDAVSSASLNVRDGGFAGNNQLMAEAVHNLVGGDLVEIVTKDPYPVDYDETVDQAHEEQKNGTLPALATEIQNMADYDVVYIGFPIWATKLPMPVESFLAQYDLSGKTVVPFCTHAGYGAGQSEARVRELCPGSAVKEILAVDDEELSHAPQMVSGWLEKLGMQKEDSSDAASVKGQDIHITIGDVVVTARLNDTPAAREFAAALPVTVSMTRMGEHEYYGSLENPLSEDGNTLQTGYEVGDLAFWTPGDLFALYFNEPQREPEGLMILGHITSDISVFDTMGNPESMLITLAD